MGQIIRKFWHLLTAPIRFIYNLFLIIIQKSPLGIFLIPDPEDTPILDTIQKAAEDPKDFLTAILGHLNDLRKHLVRSVIYLFIASSVAFYFTSDILDLLAQPIGGLEHLQAIDVTEPVGVVMRVTLLAGFTIALPLISFEILGFLAPGISRKSRLIGLVGIPLVTLFFLSGMAFAFLFMLDAALPILLNFMGIQTLPRPSSYIRFVTGMMFWIGISFEFPIISLILSAMKILPAKSLKNNWRIALITLSIFAAIITPTVDPLNMMIVLIPLWVLYGLSILTAYIGQGMRTK